MAKDRIKGIAKAHTVYKLKDGKRVPGATTITGLLNKPHQNGRVSELHSIGQLVLCMTVFSHR